MAGNAWKPPQAGCLSMLGQQSQEVQSTAAIRPSYPGAGAVVLAYWLQGQLALTCDGQGRRRTTMGRAARASDGSVRGSAQSSRNFLPGVALRHGGTGCHNRARRMETSRLQPGRRQARCRAARAGDVAIRHFTPNIRDGLECCKAHSGQTEAAMRLCGACAAPHGLQLACRLSRPSHQP